MNEWKAGDTVRVAHSPVAYVVRGPEMVDDEDTVWSGFQVPTGNVLVRMVGGEGVEAYDPSDLSPLDEDEFCHECGQIGCGHDGRDR